MLIDGQHYIPVDVFYKNIYLTEEEFSEWRISAAWHETVVKVFFQEKWKEHNGARHLSVSTAYNLAAFFGRGGYREYLENRYPAECQTREDEIGSAKYTYEALYEIEVPEELGVISCLVHDEELWLDYNELYLLFHERNPILKIDDDLKDKCKYFLVNHTRELHINYDGAVEYLNRRDDKKLATNFRNRMTDMLSAILSAAKNRRPDFITEDGQTFVAEKFLRDDLKIDSESWEDLLIVIKEYPEASDIDNHTLLRNDSFYIEVKAAYNLLSFMPTEGASLTMSTLEAQCRKECELLYNNLPKEDAKVSAVTFRHFDNIDAIGYIAQDDNLWLDYAHLLQGNDRSESLPKFNKNLHKSYQFFTIGNQNPLYVKYSAALNLLAAHQNDENEEFIEKIRLAIMEEHKAIYGSYGPIGEWQHLSFEVDSHTIAYNVDEDGTLWLSSKDAKDFVGQGIDIDRAFMSNHPAINDGEMPYILTWHMESILSYLEQNGNDKATKLLESIKGLEGYKEGEFTSNDELTEKEIEWNTERVYDALGLEDGVLPINISGHTIRYCTNKDGEVWLCRWEIEEFLSEGGQEEQVKHVFANYYTVECDMLLPYVGKPQVEWVLQELERKGNSRATELSTAIKKLNAPQEEDEGSEEESNDELTIKEKAEGDALPEKEVYSLEALGHDVRYFIDDDGKAWFHAADLHKAMGAHPVNSYWPIGATKQNGGCMFICEGEKGAISVAREIEADTQASPKIPPRSFYDALMYAISLVKKGKENEGGEGDVLRRFEKKLKEIAQDDEESRAFLKSFTPENDVEAAVALKELIQRETQGLELGDTRTLTIDGYNIEYLLDQCGSPWLNAWQTKDYIFEGTDTPYRLYNVDKPGKYKTVWGVKYINIDEINNIKLSLDMNDLSTFDHRIDELLLPLYKMREENGSHLNPVIGEFIDNLDPEDIKEAAEALAKSVKEENQGLDFENVKELKIDDCEITYALDEDENPWFEMRAIRNYIFQGHNTPDILYRLYHSKNCKDVWQDIYINVEGIKDIIRALQKENLSIDDIIRTQKVGDAVYTLTQEKEYYAQRMEEFLGEKEPEVKDGAYYDRYAKMFTGDNPPSCELKKKDDVEPMIIGEEVEETNESTAESLKDNPSTSNGNNLISFNFQDHGVRSIIDDEGNPWFAAKDICNILGIKKHRDAVTKLDIDESRPLIVDGPFSEHNYTIINESGLYSLILRSRKPEAKKFKKWITSEVLPSIRKTGGYQPQIPQTYAEALRLAADKDDENKRLRPLAEIGALLKADDETRSLRDAAKIMGFKPNKWNEWLRQNGWLSKIDKNNLPTAKAVEQGLMVKRYVKDEDGEETIAMKYT